MAITYTIKPAGGGDYTSLQAAYDFIVTEPADVFTLECYSGGNLGSLSTSANPLASGSTLIINVASGHKHNGSLTSGAYILETVDNSSPLNIFNPGCPVTINGLRLITESDYPGGCIYIENSSNDAHDVTVMNCLCKMISVLGAYYYCILLYDADVTTGSHTQTVRNNILITDEDTFNYGYGIYSYSNNYTYPFSITKNIYNNTLLGNGYGINIERSAGDIEDLDLTVNIRNNIAVDSYYTDFGSYEYGPGTLTFNSSNNASSDLTADDFGGADHLLSRVSSDEFVSITSDFRFKSGNTIDGAGYDLSGTFTDDAYGNTRSNPFSIGAYDGSNASSSSSSRSSGSSSSSSSPDPWYNCSWQYRIKLTIPASSVSANLTDYPVYVDLSDLPAGFHTNVKANGADIRITGGDGTTEFPREVVFYDSGTDTGELHFKATGTLSSSVDNTFYIYYGNAAASEPAVSDTYGRNNVWSSYLSVYHLNEAANTTAGGYKDATGNRDGTGVSTALAEVNGALSGKAVSLDGSADYISLGNSAAFQLTTGTISAWINTASAGGSYRGIVVKGAAYGLFLEDNTVATYDWGTSTKRDTNVDPTNSTWRHTAFTFQSGAGNGSKLYLDGSNFLTTTMTVLNQSTELQIGSNTTSQFFNGYIDEVRISSDVKTADWLLTEENNQNALASFYSLGSQEDDTCSSSSSSRSSSRSSSSSSSSSSRSSRSSGSSGSSGSSSSSSKTGIPTTNLQGHWNFSDTSELFQQWQAGSPFYNTAVTTTGDPICVVRHEQGTADRRLIGNNDTTRALWNSVGINSIGSADFDGSNDVITGYNDAGTVTTSVSTYITASAFTTFVAIRVTGDCSNDANMWNNDAVWCDNEGWVGLHCKTVGGVTTLYAYNYDSNVDSVGIVISQNTDYVVMVRHESGNLYISINNGSESSVASGNTGSTAGILIVGHGNASTRMPVRIGEIVIYNTALTGTDFTNAMSYFTNKWLSGSSSSSRSSSSSKSSSSSSSRSSSSSSVSSSESSSSSSVSSSSSSVSSSKSSRSSSSSSSVECFNLCVSGAGSSVVNGSYELISNKRWRKI